MISLMLVIAAFICALIAALWIPATGTPYRPHFGWLAIALWLLSLLLGMGRMVH